MILSARSYYSLDPILTTYTRWIEQKTDYVYFKVYITSARARLYVHLRMHVHLAIVDLLLSREFLALFIIDVQAGPSRIYSSMPLPLLPSSPIRPRIRAFLYADILHLTLRAGDPLMQPLSSLRNFAKDAIFARRLALPSSSPCVPS